MAGVGARLSRRAATPAAELIAWQRRHGRHDLPWQGTRDPYRVWLSEIMLQQTQVATVKAYYDRFLQRFPTLATLAAAPLDDVLALWSGLGYYSRARHLHRCAQVVVQQHGGAFPRCSDALAALPGIGRSTAAAIAVFCFDERSAILDGNVKRVLTRLLGVADDLAQLRHERALWQQAQALLPDAGDPGGAAAAPQSASPVQAYTQGLMDLGATVCTPRRPACDACPWQARCVAHAQQRPEDYPVKTRRLVRGERRASLLLLTHAGAVWLVQRPARGVWAGLWSLPQFDDDAALLALAAKVSGQPQPWAPLVHALTHFDWHLRPWHWALPARAARARLDALQQQLPPGRWVARDAALALGLAAPVRRLLTLLP